LLKKERVIIFGSKGIVCFEGSAADDDEGEEKAGNSIGRYSQRNEFDSLLPPRRITNFLKRESL
jgi:hypothetical protein